jgi:hypothetical protein
MFSWLRIRQRIPVQERQESTLRFLAEQDGEVERELKAKWATILTQHSGVTRAYLARTTSGAGPEQNVTLCVCPRSAQAEALVQALARPFREKFGSDQYLDIAFLNASQEAELSQVAKPFFPQPNTSLERTREG